MNSKCNTVLAAITWWLIYENGSRVATIGDIRRHVTIHISLIGEAIPPFRKDRTYQVEYPPAPTYHASQLMHPH